MLIEDASKMRDATGPGRRLIGLDPGTKTIGLALSDVTWTIASPLETIRRRKFRADAETLFNFVDRHDVAGLIVGLPRNMDGSEGPRCQSVRALANNLIAIRDLPVCFWDERLSTQAVNRMLIDEADASRRRRHDVVDKLAATYILQGFLDSLQNRGF